MTYIPKVELSTQQIVFTPGDGHDFARDQDVADPDLTVTVVNTTEHFVSFYLELEAAGQTTPSPASWYTVEPNVCAKKPPGDRTQFHVNLLRAPLPAYGTTIPLQVKVFSAELADLAAVETVYLKILRPTKDLRLFFPLQDLSVYPGSRLKIPVLVYNLNPQMRQVTLGIEGVDPAWFPEGHQQTVWVDGGGSLEVDFWCLPPAAATTAHQLYRLIAQAAIADENISASADGHLQILPFGRLHHQVIDPKRTIPDQLVALSQLKGGGVIYEWALKNDSNAAQIVHLEADEPTPSLQVISGPLALAAGATKQANVQVQARRPWLGWMRTHHVEVWPHLQHPDSDQPLPEITVTPTSQLLTLQVKPRIPLALQLLAGLLGGLVLWALWFLSPRPLHEGPVNTVRLLGNSNLVVSGSSDQTLRRWQVNRQPWLPDVRRLTPYNNQPDYSFDKAIRVVEVLPANLGQVAVGLENGEIYIRDVDQAVDALVSTAPLSEEGRFDRVLDLAFTHDSRYLFSGHGSGTVRVWGFRRGQWHPEKKLYLGLPPDLSFAIASLAVSPDDELVAIAGQFNRLVL